MPVTIGEMVPWRYSVSGICLERAFIALQKNKNQINTVTWPDLFLNETLKGEGRDISGYDKKSGKD